MEVRIVVMGVAGSGKTSLAIPLAESLGARFVEADDAHPAANIAKMRAGRPLDDDDRRPWLERLATELGTPPVVVTCSALKRTYRDVLRGAGGVCFVFLDLDETTALARLHDRPDHFMGPNMIASQFETLERPGDDESDVLRLDATAPVDANVGLVLAELDA